MPSDTVTRLSQSGHRRDAVMAALIVARAFLPAWPTGQGDHAVPVGAGRPPSWRHTIVHMVAVFTASDLTDRSAVAHAIHRPIAHADRRSVGRIFRT